MEYVRNISIATGTRSGGKGYILLVRPVALSRGPTGQASQSRESLQANRPVRV
jgi:hypothetical protein